MNNMIPLSEALKTIKPLKDIVTRTTLDLYSKIDEYMKNVVNGGQLNKELNFEKAIRNLLKNNGFTVEEKKNVQNSQQSIQESNSANIDSQIPDIIVKYKDGLVFLELKFQSELNMYIEDLEKVKKYLDEKKCFNAGVLFLDKQKNYKDWKTCNQNSEYSYLWVLGSKEVNNALAKHSALQEQNKINDLIDRIK